MPQYDDADDLQSDMEYEDSHNKEMRDMFKSEERFEEVNEEECCPACNEPFEKNGRGELVCMNYECEYMGRAVTIQELEDLTGE